MTTKPDSEERESWYSSAQEYVCLAARANDTLGNSDYTRSVLNKAGMPCRLPGEYVRIEEVSFTHPNLRGWTAGLLEHADGACLQGMGYIVDHCSVARLLGDRERARAMFTQGQDENSDPSKLSILAPRTESNPRNRDRIQANV